MDNLHPFDQWTENQKESQERLRKQCIEDTKLVQEVFGTEAGERLLSRWKDLLINSPTAHAGDDLLSIGMNEGNKSFIRAILNAVKPLEA